MVGRSKWQKNKVGSWQTNIIDNTRNILDNQLRSNSIYKYSINCIILKKSSLSRKSESMISKNSDFQYNLKYDIAINFLLFFCLLHDKL